MNNTPLSREDLAPYFEVFFPFYLDKPRLKISRRTDQWFGSFRNGFWYEPQLIDLFWRQLLNLRKESNNSLFFLDIGSNTGSYCFLPFFHTNITCVAYEPNPEVYDILDENIKLNQLEDKVEYYNIALWNENCTKSLKVPIQIDDCGLSTLADIPDRFVYDARTGEYKTITTECRTLDSHLKEINCNKKVDAIKIDCEGAELFVLKGAENLLLRDKPMLLLEFVEDNTRTFDYSPEDILFYLRSLGYKEFRAGAGDLFAL